MKNNLIYILPVKKNREFYAASQIKQLVHDRGLDNLVKDIYINYRKRGRNYHGKRGLTSFVCIEMDSSQKTIEKFEKACNLKSYLEVMAPKY